MTNLEMFRERILDAVKDPESAARVVDDPGILTLIIDAISTDMCVPSKRAWCSADSERDEFPTTETCRACIEWWMRQEAEA